MDVQAAGPETPLLGIRALLDDNPVVGTRRGGTKRFWTKPELVKLHEHYLAGGVGACLPVLPGRTAGSIYQRAAIEGLIPVRQRGAVPRQRWFTNPQIDAVIIRGYQRAPTSRGEINRLAQTVGRPSYWVRNRAVQLGCVMPRFKMPPWTEVEIDIVAANAARTPNTISRLLRAAGFTRSPTAVVVKLKRLGSPTGRNADTDHYTATSLAGLFGVDGHVVTGWIKKGWLQARRRGTARTAAQGGDEYQVHIDRVRMFVFDNPAAVDLRKVDKFWFLDLVSGRL